MKDALTPADKARALLASLPEGTPGPLTAELDVFDPDEREAEASVNDEGVSVLFTAGTGEMFPTGTQTAADLARWRALEDSKPMRYARLFAAAPDLRDALVAALDREDSAMQALRALVDGWDCDGWADSEAIAAARCLINPGASDAR